MILRTSSLSRSQGSIFFFSFILYSLSVRQEHLAGRGIKYMAAGALLEPLAVTLLLAGGAIINHNRSTRGSVSPSPPGSRAQSNDRLGTDLERSISRTGSGGAVYKDINSGLLSPSVLAESEGKWRRQEVGLLSWRKRVTSPSTRIYRGIILSDHHKFPFLRSIG